MTEKKGFETSSTTRPMVLDAPSARRSVPAVWLWRYPSSATASWTLTANSAATGLPLTTRETVLTLTPATAATSLIVGRRPFGGPAGDVVTRAAGGSRPSRARSTASAPRRFAARRSHRADGGTAA